MQAVEIAVQQRLDARIHSSGDAPLELAKLGKDRVPRRDVSLGPAFAGDRERALLMCGVFVAV